MFVFDRQQAHVGRPRQREGLGKRGEINGVPRQCLGNGCAGRFARRCLPNLWGGRFVGQRPINLFGGPRLIEQAHLLQVVDTKSTPKTHRQVGREPFEQGASILGSILSPLFKLDNAAANFPVAGGHQSIDAACGGAAGRFQQFDDVGMDGGVVGLLRQGRRAAVGHACASATSASISPKRRITSASWLRMAAIRSFGSACSSPALALGFLRSRL